LLNPLAWVAFAGLAAYRWLVPASAKPQCRFVPSCSTYTSRSIVKYGVRTGLARGMLRVHRCIGFGGSGIDEP
jgi:putative component of membrane protein insertase Oxa1/YidC/SpoIIIJ protein YidD